MPLYEFQCLNGHRREIFEFSAADKGCETVICECGHSMGPVFSPGKGIVFFEEGRPRVINNLGPEPVTITSFRQHKEAMKRAGVVEAGSNPRSRIEEKGRRWV